MANHRDGIMSRINDSFLVDLLHNGDFSNNERGDLQTIAGRDNLRQAIFHRLITVAGTVIHRPEYGIGIKQYQGVISSLDKQRELALKIREQIEQDTRIESVDSVKFTQDTNNAEGKFYVHIKITASGVGELDETINPFG
jgi:phage baseplate assembly protein W